MAQRGGTGFPKACVHALGVPGSVPQVSSLGAQIIIRGCPNGTSPNYICATGYAEIAEKAKPFQSARARGRSQVLVAADSVKQTELFIFYGIRAQISKYLIRRGHHAGFPAAIGEQFPQHRRILRGTFVRIPETADITLLYPRKMRVQLAIKILPIASTQRHAETEIDDAFHPCVKAIVENPVQIFRRVIDIRQNRAKPHDRRNSAPLKLFQNLVTSMRGTDIRLNNTAKVLVCRGQRYLYDRLGVTVDPFVKVDVPQDAVGFRDDRHAAVVLPRPFPPIISFTCVFSVKMLYKPSV